MSFQQRSEGNSEPAFGEFQREKYISIESYRRNGEPVRRPVWFVEDNGILYVRTDDTTGKVKQIRRNPKIRIAISNFRGTPKGDWVDATAEIRTGPEVEEKFSMLQKKYGLTAKLLGIMNRFSRSKAQEVLIAIHP